MRVPRYVNGIKFNDVVCNDPTKGGLIFSFGTRNGIIKNSVSTLTGDDATSSPRPTTVLGGTRDELRCPKRTSYRSRTIEAGTLCSRGADDIVTTNSDIGAGSGVGTVNIGRSGDAHEFSSTNITLSTSIIKPDADENGVSVRDPGIQDTDNGQLYLLHAASVWHPAIPDHPKR